MDLFLRVFCTYGILSMDFISIGFYTHEPFSYEVFYILVFVHEHFSMSFGPFILRPTDFYQVTNSRVLCAYVIWYFKRLYM